MTPAQRVAAVMSAGAIAIGTTIAVSEGKVNVGYPDPGPKGVTLPTACYGSTKGIVIGKRYTDDECAEMLAEDVMKHGLEIDKCLTRPIPEKTRAAFISFAFNVGTGKFCASSLARKANAGDLRGACAELSKWTWAGTRQLPGLVRRRAAERALCEEGLTQ